MRTFARSGFAAVVALFGSILLSFTATANAAVVYQANNAYVRITGDAATALAACINDARDGVIQHQQNACDNTAAANNIVTLEDVRIWVQQAPGRPILFTSNNATVDISGGPVTAIAECVNDAQDGIIQTQQNACNNTSVAGNIVGLVGVGVTVHQ